MAKIVIIGAGSHVFASRFITDIIYYPELRDSTITLMDIAAEPLELTAAFCLGEIELASQKPGLPETPHEQGGVI